MNATPTLRGFCLVLLLLVVTDSLMAKSAAAAIPAVGPITVTLASGRTLTAEVAAQTDLRTLWLRWGRAGLIIQQPIAWDHVVEVLVAGRRSSAAEFLQSLALEKTVLAAPAQRKDRTIVIGAGPSRQAEAAAIHSPTPSPRTATTWPQQSGRVQMLAVDAGIANWNSTAEIDGLVIEVAPLNAAGTLTPVRGTLEVELLGCEATNRRPGHVFPRIGHWVQRIEIGDFTSRGARYRMAFQQVRPDADLTLSPLATLHARLSVPGEGVFETTALVRIRTATAIRDRL